MPPSFVASVRPPEEPTGSVRWYLFQGFRLLATNQDGRASVPEAAQPGDFGLDPVHIQYLGFVSGDEPIHCFCGEVEDGTAAPEGMSFENLRALFPLLDETSFWVAGRAVQIVDWDRNHQYCGHCGQPTRHQDDERAKVCSNCGLVSYPRLAPAVIVRVERMTTAGPQILLARAPRFPVGMFSVLAGFVEPGETLEECVQREVREEVGLDVTNIRYFGSQPWPFPHSLMIAFVAEPIQGDLVVDTAELVEAGWYSVDSLPAIPQPPSIANRLITGWIADVAGASTARGT